MYHSRVAAIAYFVFQATATTENYTYGHTLSLHAALPISAIISCPRHPRAVSARTPTTNARQSRRADASVGRSGPARSLPRGHRHSDTAPGRGRWHHPPHEAPPRQPARRASGAERKSVVSGKSESVRVDPGGRRIIQKKKKIRRSI